MTDTDRHFVRWGGSKGTVETDLDLGRGSTRGLPQYGIRRALWDIAFGYISGFPKRHIAYFVLTRSLSHRLSLWVMRREGITIVDGHAVATIEWVADTRGVRLIFSERERIADELWERWLSIHDQQVARLLDHEPRTRRTFKAAVHLTLNTFAEVTDA